MQGGLGQTLSRDGVPGHTPHPGAAALTPGALHCWLLCATLPWSLIFMVSTSELMCLLRVVGRSLSGAAGQASAPRVQEDTPQPRTQDAP